MATPFGWCLTAQHEQCIVTSVDGTRTCPCTCPNHGTDRPELTGASDTMVKLIEEHYPEKKPKK